MAFGDLGQQIPHFFSDFDMDRNHDLLIFFDFTNHLHASRVINF